MKYSIVVPVYNSEKSLEELYTRINDVFVNVIKESYELILVDDFSKNLREWVDTGDNFIGIKFMNGINGTKGTWAGYLVSNKMSAAQLVNAITGIAKAEAAA